MGYQGLYTNRTDRVHRKPQQQNLYFNKFNKTCGKI